MSEQPTPDGKLLACPKCHGQPIQSADVEYVRPKSNEFRSIYYWHCFEGCGFESPKTYNEPESWTLWNDAVRVYRADHQASEDAFHEKLP